MTRRIFTILITWLCSCGLAPAADSIEFELSTAPGRLRILIGGQEALVYHYGTNWDLPHFYPVRSPSGKSMTVEKPDPYPHHRSFWFADTVQLEGHRQASFYNALYSGRGDKQDPQPPFRDHIRQVSLTVPDNLTAAHKRELITQLIWEMDDAKVPVLDETRWLIITALANGEYFLDLEFMLVANYGAVTFQSDAVHYAWPFIRLNQDFNASAGGVLVNSEGSRGEADTNMKIARWVDFSRGRGATAEGLAMFSHPTNEQPHQWLTRDYGCFGPRRIAAKSGKPFVLSRGEKISTRVGVLVHRGDVQSGQVAERYQLYFKGEL